MNKGELCRLNSTIEILTDEGEVYVTENPEVDLINHPPHYTMGNIEVIDAIEDWKLSYNLGNVVKYVARANHKGNPIQDLSKAIFYLQREISRLGNERDKK